MGAKLMQLKMIIDETEETLEKYDSKNKVDADLLKAEKAMAYERMRELVSNSPEGD